MRFNYIKHFLFVSSLILIIQCGGSNYSDDYFDGESSVLLGSSLKGFSSSSASGVSENSVIMIDEFHNLVLEFQVDPFELKQKIKIPTEMQAEQILVGAKNQFFLLQNGAEFGILKKDGSYQKNPIDLFGEIEGVAYDPSSNIMVIQDSFRALALVKLSDAGDIEESWVGGPLIDSGASFSSGTISGGGDVVLGLSDGRLAKIDFDKSIEKEKWVFENFEVSLADEESDEETDEALNLVDEDNQILWLSGIQGSSQFLWGRNKSTLFVVDLDSKEIVDQQSFETESVIGHFNEAEGHFVLRSEDEGANVFEIYTANDEGNLVKTLVQFPESKANALDANDATSVLDTELDLITISSRSRRSNRAYGNYSGRSKQLLAFRFSDSKVVSINSLDLDDKVAVSAKHLVVLKKSPMGVAERVKLGKARETERLKGFNLKEVRGRE